MLENLQDNPQCSMHPGIHTSWYSLTIGLYNQQNMVEGIGCHSHDYVIKDSVFHLCCIYLHSHPFLSHLLPSLSLSPSIGSLLLGKPFATCGQRHGEAHLARNRSLTTATGVEVGPPSLVKPSNCSPSQNFAASWEPLN